MTDTNAITKRLENEVSLLERHVKMLKTIKENEPIGIIRLAELLGHPQHKVRYSLRILEQEGLIVPSPDGAVTTEKFDEFMKDIDRLLEDMEKAVNRLKIELKSP
ncbi:hypothetical protein A3207_06570 [Candidatus Methanomassiliicoccus intestinalis]|jgi:hypothetical protein|uniref:Uncharacterized protein n=1 Tax=Candidatus Methanomassiliicoccus intestinalis TaxID=1406512 RepID=A0A8J8PGC4_9ARCH|nr:MAG: hypothetical protein A3207_06570 [Candidatus Methanomassiliicoccus intestinalis]